MIRNTILIISSLILITFISMGQNRLINFDIKDFIPIDNHPNIDTVKYVVDLENAINCGIIIPTKKGNEDYFKFSFKIRNNRNKSERYYYKIFYQNVSYAHDLFLDSLRNIKNPQAKNNFYGSWNENTGFHTTGVINCEDGYVKVIDSFNILGNPRNESRFFGNYNNDLKISEKEIENSISRIRNTKNWMTQIQRKAIENKITVEKQLYLDAVWSVKYDKEQGNYNNRWKRNPRTGLYNFLLVVVKEDDFDKIPYYFKDITIKDSVENTYQNPYQFFLSRERSECIFAALAEQRLHVKVIYELDKGIYTGDTTNNENISKLAQFEQYFHSMDKKQVLQNIPLKRDILANQYSLEDYNKGKAEASKANLINDFIRITKKPGSTVGFDKSKNAIFLTNPGNDKSEDFRKENVGVQCRHGFTYGKFIAKIRFPKIINSSYVWNGLTCAFWLKNQEGNWNRRSLCASGYNPKLYSDSVKVKSCIYSEIDIEIVKTSKFWPKTSYGGRSVYPKDNALNNKIILACTNWDLACHDPTNFNIGVRDVIYKSKNFTLHRWDDDYRALTSKYELDQDSVLGRDLYYVIEWTPTYIIWKVGATKHNLVVIGFMDCTNTKIPDNQMQMVFTQEFHLSKWWPLTPFKQEFIPYPLNSITGYIYEVEIE